MAKKNFLRVKDVALAKGLKGPLDLMYAARIAQHTAYGVWNDKYVRVDQTTLQRISAALGVPIPELFVNNMEMEETEKWTTPSPAPAEGAETRCE